MTSSPRFTNFYLQVHTAVDPTFQLVTSRFSSLFFSQLIEHTAIRSVTQACMNRAGEWIVSVENGEEWAQHRIRQWSRELSRVQKLSGVWVEDHWVGAEQRVGSEKWGGEWWSKIVSLTLHSHALWMNNLSLIKHGSRNCQSIKRCNCCINTIWKSYKQRGLRDSVVTMSVVIHQLIVGMIHQPADPSMYSHVLPRSESTVNVKRQCFSVH